MRIRTTIAGVGLGAGVVLGAAVLAPVAPTHAYHCYSDVVGDCSVVQHMLEDLEANTCLFLEKATKGLYDCGQ